MDPLLVSIVCIRSYTVSSDMGFKCSKICNHLCSTRISGLRIGLFGLNNSGKTTILYQLKLGQSIEPEPTIGFNVETISFQGLSVNIWEISGSRQERTRALWNHYNQNINAIIFVIDSADLTRLSEAIQTLQWLCRQPELSNAYFLIYANKQDLPGALSKEDLTALFELPKLLPYRKWVIEQCSALTCVGLEDGLCKLIELCHKE